MTDLLTLAGVHTHVGRYHILHGVDFVVPEGQTTMLLGRNGAGKTSTLRTIMGLWQASAGQITLAGQRIEASATPDIARLGVGYVPESMAVFSDLTVKENLDARRARRTARRCQAGMDFRILPGAAAVLAVARGLAVRRTEADAVDRARHRRAAQAAADRRADQGSRPGHRRGADRMLCRNKTPRRHHPCWSSRISMPRAKSAIACW